MTHRHISPLLLALCVGCGDGCRGDDTAPVDDSSEETGDPTVDADNDGYPASEDCDDEDPDVNPGAEEICGNGVDDDCDGTANDCGLSGLVPLSEADVAITGAAESDWAGRSFDLAGDHDGDGSLDLVVGGRHHTSDDGEVGAVFVMSGPFEADGSMADATATWLGSSDMGEAGDSVANGCDLSGDGAADIIVGARSHDAVGEAAGAVYLIFDPGSGEQILDDAAVTIFPTDAQHRLGDAVGCAGDPNDDGVADLVVAAPGAQNSDEDVSGMAYLFEGPIAEGELTTADADATFRGVAHGDYLGRWVDGGHDLDGDGLTDLVLTAFKAGVAGVDAGEVYGVLAPFDGEIDLMEADWVISGERPGDWLGTRAEVAGDIDGDGTPDLLIGADGHDQGGNNAGAGYFVPGPPAGQALVQHAAAATITGMAAEDYTGLTVTGTGDLDGDGSDDFAVGAFRSDAGQLNAGLLAVFYDAIEGVVGIDTADVEIIGTQADDQAGFHAMATGDISGDGWPDIALSAPAEDTGGRDSGAIYLVFGSGW